MQDMLWETRDERLILVFRMETDHVLKCIEKIQNNWPWRAKYLDRLEMELIMRWMKDHI
jgi:hypothetical protein